MFFRLFGSKVMEITQDGQSIEILSTSIGFVRFILLLSLCICIAIVRGVWQKRKAEDAARYREQGLVAFGVIVFCLLVILAMSYKKIVVRASHDNDRVMVTEQGILSVLWMDHQEIPIQSIDEIRAAYILLKGSQSQERTQSDKAGYYLRIDTYENKQIRGSSNEVNSTKRTVRAVRALAEFLNNHPSRTEKPVRARTFNYE